MILRNWRAKLNPARFEAYRRFEREQCLPMFRRQPGFLAVLFLRETEDGVASLTIWDNKGGVAALTSSPSYGRAARELAESGLLLGEQAEEVFEVEDGYLRPEALLGALGR